MASERKRRAKRRVRIVIHWPDGKEIRIEGDDTTVAPEAIAAWSPVCDRLSEVITDHLAARRSARPHPEDGRSQP